MLIGIFNSDCPCLRDDSGAIQAMRSRRIVWQGSSVSIEVKSTQQVTDRLWIITAVMSGVPFQIKNESGDLIRSVPAERELIRFAMTKPSGHDQWLLGNASSIRRIN